MPVTLVCGNCGDAVDSVDEYNYGKCCQDLPPVWAYNSATGTYTRSRVEDADASPGEQDDPDEIDEEQRWACERCETNEVVIREVLYASRPATMLYSDGVAYVGDVGDQDVTSDEFNGVECAVCGRNVDYDNISW